MRGVRTILLSLLLLFAVALPALAETPAADSARQAVYPLNLSGTARQIFQRLARRYKVTIRMGSTIRRGRLTLQMKKADLESALQAATALAGAFWIRQDDGSILILDDTPENRTRYEQQYMQTFTFLGYTNEEQTEVLRLLQEMIEPRYMAQDLRTNTVTLRDTKHRLEIAATLLEQWTTQRSEVVVDALVLEVDSNKARSLGVLPPDLAVLVHVGAGILPTDNAQEFLQALQSLVNQGVLPAVLLSDRFDLAQGVGFVGIGGGRSQYLVNLPGTSVTFSEFRSMTQNLRSTTLRSNGGQEATFFAGERFPVAFTTFSTIFVPQVVQDLIDQGLFVPPVPAIQYEDLGLKLTVLPNVHDNREVSLKVAIESTQLAGQSVNSIPILANRKIEQQVRLKAGESMVLAGLRGQENTPSRIGLPLGRLFSRKTTSTRETEFMVLLTPRIVRRVERDASLTKAIYLGTEKEFSPQGPPKRRARPRRQPTPGRQPTPVQPGQPRQPARPGTQPQQRQPRPPQQQQQQQRRPQQKRQ
jgi:general secretion pathway protein D